MKKTIGVLFLMLLFSPFASAGVIRHGAKAVKKSPHAVKVVVKSAAKAAKAVVF